MPMTRGAASLIGDHDDDSVPISQDASVENKNGSSATRPAKKKQKVEEGNSSVPISQDDDERRDRAAFERWCRLIREDGYEYGDYNTGKEKERRFKYFQKSLHREVNPLLKESGIYLIQFADRSPNEFKKLTNNFGMAYSYISHEILDEWEKLIRERREQSVEDFCGCVCGGCSCGM